MVEITSSLEDYIETLYSIYSKEQKVRAIDVARKLNVSRASVTEALQKLDQLGLINYGHYGAISLTEKGEEKAKEIIEKHETLTMFFSDILKIEPVLAEETACKIEHVISNRILKEWKKHIQKCLKEEKNKIKN